jgi:hypothetical protein
MSHSTLKDGLVSWWDLTEDPATGIMPDQMKRHSLVTSGVTRVNGPSRTAVHMETGSRMSAVRSSSNSVVGRDYSVAMWLKVGTLTVDSNNVLFGRQPTNGAHGEFRISWGALRNPTMFDSSGTEASAFPVVLPLDVWHFVVMARRGTDIFYKINGYSIFKAFSLVGPTVTNNYDLCVGCDPAGLVDLDVSLQRVGFWFRGLNDAELIALWNEGDGLFFDELKEANCKETVCCPEDDYSYKANQGTDADGDVDRGGPKNPACPDGYVWGGLSCLREQEPQVCSEGYFWNGIKCTTNEECANGYYVNPDFPLTGCQPCVPLAAPTLVVTPGVNITATFPASNLLVWRSLDGVNYVAVQYASGDTYIDTDVEIGKPYWYFGSVYDNNCGELIDGPPSVITFF